MQRQSERMRSIVQDLLELSRLEASGGDAEQVPVDVGGMLALMRKDVLARTERPAEFVLRLDERRDAARVGIRTAFDLPEPVSNAVKYTPREGRIEIR